ncbi:hypothetical protein Nepgr_021825 [Nepenthes gracilis]|uniref:Uncharacterized protein n=1 Tax=Nepenthes gracilis TaxID=150966 RepID=A0AAD3SZW4_NEPGR|nr:hypothetical protein Nepgr_021825 [Nepenthes gracilis]
MEAVRGRRRKGRPSRGNDGAASHSGLQLAEGKVGGAKDVLGESKGGKGHKLVGGLREQVGTAEQCRPSAQCQHAVSEDRHAGRRRLVRRCASGAARGVEDGSAMGDTCHAIFGVPLPIYGGALREV